MKLESLKLKNFRSYKEEIEIKFENLTTFIGKNDVGKSTILEALEIFFNNSLVKIDSNDFNVFNTENNKIEISCVFSNLPNEIILDSSVITDLESEFLVNSERQLEVKKIYTLGSNGRITTKSYIIAKYPTNFSTPLINLKQNKLREIIREKGIQQESIDMRSNVSMRKGIYSHVNLTDGFHFNLVEIPLDKEDAKMIWSKLEDIFPIYALFQADRPSTDDDNEIQDPMKIAIKQALELVQEQLHEIKKVVREETLKTANYTLDKLKEMNPDLASELIADFSSEPQWEKVFKLTLNSENNIPVNKRGSGVRRLILLNFFRAEAERKKQQNNRGIIYAIEEPETAQHPNNQKLLIESLQELSQNNTQIIITTHVPGIAELLPTTSIRYITPENKQLGLIRQPSDDQLLEIADRLGVLPDHRVKLLLCVEGKNDVTFLKQVSKILYKAGKTSINLFNDDRVAILPLGGSKSLKQFIQNKYLKSLRLPEFHIMDKDDNNDISQLNRKLEELNNNSKIVLTERREMENYIHKDVIADYFVSRYSDLGRDYFDDIDFNDGNCDIPKSIYQLLVEHSDKLGNDHPPSEDTIKRWLNNSVVSKMSLDKFEEMGVEGEIIGWFNFMEGVIKPVKESV